MKIYNNTMIQPRTRESKFLRDIVKNILSRPPLPEGIENKRTLSEIDRK